MLWLVTLLVSAFSVAKDIPRSDVKFLSECAQSKDCEINLIMEIGKTYRPPKEESELREYILNIKATAEKYFWKRKLETFHDDIGNVMIRLPATGRFSKKNYKYLALQSHMDMVLAYTDAKPGEDIRPYFKDGVKLEIKDGWLQSVGNKTSIGADNSTGVAFSLRYLIDPSIEHPPLEIIFTVQEEIGLVGAMESNLPIKSRKMICLDGMTPEPGYIIAGSQGASANHMQFESLGKILPKDKYQVVKISLTKLAGGHSGGDIHRERANGIKVFGNTLKYLMQEYGDVGVMSVVVGDVGVLNKIPNIMGAEFVIPVKNVKPDLQKKLEVYIKSIAFKNPDDAKDGRLEISLKELTHEKASISTNDFNQFLVGAIDQSPNGVLEKEKPFANDIKLSNNLSFLQVGDPKSSGKLTGEFGFMVRGFHDPSILATKEKIVGHFKHEHLTKNFQTKQVMDISAWIEPENSPLLLSVMSIPQFSKKYYIAGGLEPSAFKKKYPDLEVVALGPFMQYAHSVNERLKVDTVAPTGQNILRIIQAQGE